MGPRCPISLQTIYVQRGVEIKSHMNILPDLFRGGADICVPLVRLVFVEMTRPSIYNI